MGPVRPTSLSPTSSRKLAGGGEECGVSRPLIPETRASGGLDDLEPPREQYDGRGDTRNFIFQFISISECLQK